MSPFNFTKPSDTIQPSLLRRIRENPTCFPLGLRTVPIEFVGRKWRDKELQTPYQRRILKQILH